MDEAQPVLDASALIALLLAEPGAERVDEMIAGGALISAVNWTEVLDVTASLGLELGERRGQVEQLGVSIASFTPEQGELAAQLRPAAREHGLSLADRACLAVARAVGAPAITGDRAWTEVEAGVEVVLFR